MKLIAAACAAKIDRKKRIKLFSLRSAVEKGKESKHGSKCAALGYDFLPAAFTSFGGWGEAIMKVLQKVAVPREEEAGEEERRQRLADPAVEAGPPRARLGLHCQGQLQHAEGQPDAPGGVDAG